MEIIEEIQLWAFTLFFWVPPCVQEGSGGCAPWSDHPCVLLEKNPRNRGLMRKYNLGDVMLFVQSQEFTFRHFISGGNTLI